MTGTGREYTLANGEKRYWRQVKYKGKTRKQRGFKTLKEAEKWARQTLNELEAEQSTAHILMYSQACNEYIADCQARLQPNTIQEKKNHLMSFAAFVAKDFPIAQLATQTAQEYLAFTQTEKGNVSANRHQRTLKALWNWHIRRGNFLGNPWAQTVPYPEDSETRYIPPAEDVIAVLKAAEDWEYDFLQVILKTGARAGEVRNLQWTDVDLRRATLTLWTRKRKGGAKEPRAINMSAQLLQIITRRYEAKGDNEYVFTNPLSGKPFTRQSRPMKYLMERLCPLAGVKPFTLHALRHFVALTLRDSGKATPFDLQRVLGHQRLQTTETYLRSLSPDLEGVVSILDDLGT
ncbi:tyrosine-type recombinase/integrase [Oleidesulfovibrio sp.]|uniref:tyrosine-type recombinase/integrase n=1 Tax=Oleidesulfovibrio sp. TaxID=2909707 RepID=UPI003A84E329